MTDAEQYQITDDFGLTYDRFPTKDAALEGLAKMVKGATDKAEALREEADQLDRDAEALYVSEVKK